MIVEKKLKLTKSTWDVLAEVDDLLQNSPGWQNVDWKAYKRKLEMNSIHMQFTGNKRYLKQARERFKI